MSSFPCIRNGRQKSGFIIARSFQGLWFHEVDCDNQEWFHVRVAESDVVEEEQLHPPRRLVMSMMTTTLRYGDSYWICRTV